MSVTALNAEPHYMRNRPCFPEKTKKGARLMKFHLVKELKSFFILWLTQSLSALGSTMTGFALIIVLYKSSG